RVRELRRDRTDLAPQPAEVVEQAHPLGRQLPEEARGAQRVHVMILGVRTLDAFERSGAGNGGRREETRDLARAASAPRRPARTRPRGTVAALAAAAAARRA